MFLHVAFKVHLRQADSKRNLFTVAVVLSVIISYTFINYEVGEILRSKIHKLINSIWNKENFPYQWKESIIVTIQKGD
jgi:hypothetical protein